MSSNLFMEGNQVQPILLEQRQTHWQDVEILEHPVFGRQLVIDGDLQISESDFSYNAALTAPLLTLADCRQVAILGGGDGGVLREILGSFDRLDKPLETVNLIDIDGDVIDLCATWMPRLCGDAFEDARSEVIVGDAFAWIEQAADLDAVVYDLTMDPVREDMSQPEFVADILNKVHDSLRDGGVISLQACGEWSPGREALLHLLHEKLETCFGSVQEQQVVVPSYHEMWTFLSACKV